MPKPIPLLAPVTNTIFSSICFINEELICQLIKSNFVKRLSQVVDDVVYMFSTY